MNNSPNKKDRFKRDFSEEWKKITEQLKKYDLSHIKLVATEGK